VAPRRSIALRVDLALPVPEGGTRALATFPTLR
jgi:hypothetical protein